MRSLSGASEHRDASPSVAADVVNAVSFAGFAFVAGGDMRKVLEQKSLLSDWPLFESSWDALEIDTYMADKGRYRKRRHGVFAADFGKAARRETHQPHYQGLDYNPLNGGVARWFAPMLPEVVGSVTFQAFMSYTRDTCDVLKKSVRSWYIEAHQFRIEAGGVDIGQPTPEGMHRDGVDYAFVFLIRRLNIQSGTTEIQNIQRETLDSFTLTEACDAAILDDHRVFHGVTAVKPLDPALPAFRDVLVITYRES